MRYPSLTKTLLLATTLSAAVSLPVFASNGEEFDIDSQQNQTEVSSTNNSGVLEEVNLTDPKPAVLEEPSRGFFGWLFRSSSSSTPAPTSKDPLTEEVPASPASSQDVSPSPSLVPPPSEEPAPLASTQPSADPASEKDETQAPPKPARGSLFNPFNWFGSYDEDIQSPQLDKKEAPPLENHIPVSSTSGMTTDVPPSEVQTSEPSSDSSHQKEDEGQEGEGDEEDWQPASEPSSSSSSSSSSPMGYQDVMSSMMLDQETLLRQLKETKLSFERHPWAASDRLRLLELPSGSKFSLYPQATYTLRLGEIDQAFSGTQLDAAVRSGKSFEGLWLWFVSNGEETLKTFEAQGGSIPALLPAHHLFFETLKEGAELVDATPNPAALVRIGDTRFVVSDKDRITLRQEGSPIKHVQYPYLAAFLEHHSDAPLAVTMVRRQGIKEALYTADAAS